MRKLSGKQRRQISVALGIALIICLGLPIAGFASYNLLYFAKELLGTPTQHATEAVPAVPILASTATPAPVCGGPQTMFILLIGSDSRADSYSAGLADSMRIVRVDFVYPSVSYLVFQRDLYVEIPGISSHGGITHGKLNQAYLYGNPAMGYFDGLGQGPGLLAATLQHNFEARIDHHVAVNLQSFERIVDHLGGLDIDLPYTIDGRVTRSLDPARYFPAGQQHLDGYRTMLLARLRPNGDLERSRAQDLILQAFAAKLLQPATLARLPALAEAFHGSVQSDLGAPEITALLCLAAMLEPSDLRPLSFPDELLSGARTQDPVLGNTFIWEADFDLLRLYVRHFNEGTWPDSPLAPESTLAP